MQSDDLTALLAGTRDSSTLGARVGKVIEWDTPSRSYSVAVGGKVLYDVPMLATATLTSVRPGDSVMMMRYQDTFIIVGRVVAPGDVQPEPNLSIPMFPNFITGGTPNLPGAQQIGSTTQADWYGYTRVTHPKLFMIATLGQLSGSGQVVPFDVMVDGSVVDSFTVTTLVTATYGPFDISDFADGNVKFIRIMKKAGTAGSGQTAFHVYSVAQRSY